jgi:hypothetical protein
MVDAPETFCDWVDHESGTSLGLNIAASLSRWPSQGNARPRRRSPNRERPIAPLFGSGARHVDRSIYRDHGFA